MTLPGPEDTPSVHAPRLVLVTGPSGAGRSTAIKVLEDIGFEAIDNLPLSLLPRLMDGPPLTQSLALGVERRLPDIHFDGIPSLLRLHRAGKQDHQKGKRDN